VEQFVRDARIAQIYEGANGIQALDLIGRKLPEGGGRLLRRFFHPMQAYLEAKMADPALSEFTTPLLKGFARLQQLTLYVAQQGLADPEEAGAASSEYLRFFGHVALGWMWCRMAEAALKHKGDDADGYYAAKLSLARFYFQRLFPETAALGLSIMAGKKPIMELAEAAF
jgi:butyryl-CoA dehydrogenase